jgi:hypothetical protein
LLFGDGGLSAWLVGAGSDKRPAALLAFKPLIIQAQQVSTPMSALHVATEPFGLRRLGIMAPHGLFCTHVGVNHIGAIDSCEI